jgi:phosphate butyryltransferase
MILKSLQDLKKIASNSKKPRLCVAASADKHVLEAVRDAVKENVVDVILVGDKAKTIDIAEKINFNLKNVEIIHEMNDIQACKIAVKQIVEAKADILMKGLVSTAPLLKAVLDKEDGLRAGDTLSHFALVESPYYHKLIAVTDAAMNVNPEFNDKVAIVKNAVKAMSGVGVINPKVAIITPLETVNPKIESTVHAAMLVQMNKRGQIPNCIIDGPLALDNALSKEACEIKKIKTEVGGDADILVAPELNAANILYKAFSFAGGAKTAAVIVGAKCPIVLTSRADSEHSKLFSIILAAAMLTN